MRDVDKSILLYKNMKERFLDANVNIRKWCTNNENLPNIIEYSEKLYKKENLVNKNDKVLGDCNGTRTHSHVICIIWNDLDDILVFDVKEMFKDALHINPTKRNILKVIASAYDPIRVLQPIWIKLKILFQNICKMNLIEMRVKAN